jgi:hypothetical protein
MFENAAVAEAASKKAHDEAEVTGEAVNSYSLVVLVFALGIVLAGLAALRRDGTWLRGIFVIAASGDAGVRRGGDGRHRLHRRPAVTAS